MSLTKLPRGVSIVLVLACALAAPAAAQVHHEGHTGPGSLYEIDVPQDWNGTLVLYAHGIVPADAPVMLPSADPVNAALRDGLLALGFAVAASSYSSNGWALDDAVRRTHQLRGLFTAKVGRAHHTLLVGGSMGALAAVKLSEQHPAQYDGVLALCGPLGGAQAEIQYAGDAWVTFDYYFPGVLPAPFGPADPYAVLAALAADPAAAAQWISAAQLPGANPAELQDSAVFASQFIVRYAPDFSARVNGKMPYDNMQTMYSVFGNAGLGALLNAGVDRYEADPAALNYYERNYETSGDLGVPVVTLHNTRDPAIPFEHEALFAEKVAEAGRSDLLLQIPVDTWGHCNFTPTEVQYALGKLLQWVMTGQKPTLP